MYEAKIKMYQKGIVSFIDILGFRDIVLNRSFEDTQRILNITRERSQDDCQGIEGVDPSVVNFSDSITRVRLIDTPLNIAEPYGCLFYELLGLARIQIDLILQGVFIRGGITVGLVHSSQGEIFGPGMVEAYELESKYAVYPRIIVAIDVLKEFEKNPLFIAQQHNKSQERKFIHELLCKGDDGLLYIDYLRIAQDEIYEPESYLNFIARHKKEIMQGLKNFNKLDSKRLKYLWLKQYHNSVIGELNKEGLNEIGVDQKKLYVP